MSVLMAVDPGLRGCGVAWFAEERLVGARYVKNPVAKGDGMDAVVAIADAVVLAGRGPVLFIQDVPQVAVEFPHVYPGSRAKGDPHDLLTLAAIDGAICAHWRPDSCRRLFPSEWKGNMDPDVLIQRVKGRLTPEELVCVELPAKSLQHNVWDAIGIGLFCIGRLDRKMVIARGSAGEAAR